MLFLVADTQLYKRLCPSVGRSVRRSVGPWTRVEKWGNERFRTFLVADSCISAPAHPSATDGCVSGLVFYKNNFFQFFADFNHKNYTQEKFFHMYVSETHIHKIHFLLEIFRLFLGPRHPKLKKHKKWNISSGFQ